MTVTNLVPSAFRGTFWGGVRRGATPVLMIGAVLALAPLLTGYLSRGDEVTRLDRQLSALTAEVGATGTSLDQATERVLELSAETTTLRSAVNEKDATIAEMSARLEVLEAAAAGSSGLQESFDSLVGSYDLLKTENNELQEQLASMVAQWAPVVELETFGPSGNPLLLNKSLDAWVTEPLCTGSMEPAISCDDLLVVYPPRFTDLNVGDIIIFRRQNAVCNGYVEGGTIVHRITRVTSQAGQGLAFETKGDANLRADPCTVPVTDVTAKVLAVVHDARTPD